ncbi:glycosyltransferase family 4 protein [Clostridium perfringens]|nr:glycosyltransferase family 4 protein [Clostridium perfringens]
MKILHICLACFYIDNYGYQENILPKYHKKLGYDVSILASLLSFNKDGESCYLDKEDTYLNENEIKVIRVDYLKRFKKISRFFRIFKNTYKIIEDENPDIIFIHGCQFMDIITVVKYLKKNRDVVVYFDNHADEFNSASNWLSKNILHKFIWKYCAKKIEPYTKKIYGVLPIRETFLLKYYNMPKEKVELLPMGSDTEVLDEILKIENREKIRKDLNIKNSDFIIVTGGKIDYKKNIHLLIEAINQIGNKEIKLLIFGTYSKEIANKFEELIKNENIIFLGWATLKEKYRYFIASDLAIFPGTHSTLWEEAVGCGIPCIFKLWDGMYHLDVGGNCEFMEEVSTDIIIDKILYFYNNRNKLIYMKNIANKKGKEVFSYENIAKRSIQF